MLLNYTFHSNSTQPTGFSDLIVVWDYTSKVIYVFTYHYDTTVIHGRCHMLPDNVLAFIDRLQAAISGVTCRQSGWLRANKILPPTGSLPEAAVAVLAALMANSPSSNDDDGHYAKPQWPLDMNARGLTHGLLCDSPRHGDGVTGGLRRGTVAWRPSRSTESAPVACLSL